MQNIARWIDFAGLLAVAVITWQLGYWILGDLALASPGQTLEKLSSMLTTTRFQQDVLTTLIAVVRAVFWAALIGILTGFVLGMNRIAGDVVGPILDTMYAIPKVAFYPIFLSIFGLTMSGRVAFGAAHGAFPIALLTMQAIQNVRPSFLRTAQVMGMGPVSTFVHILLPAAAGGIATALRIGVAVTILGVLVSEMFASKNGLGYRLISAIDIQDIPTITSVALLLSVIALLVNAVFRAIEKRLS